MKNRNLRQIPYIILVAIIIISFITSCSKEFSYEEADMLTFNNLLVIMPDSHFESELYLSEEDYKQIFKDKNPSLKSGEIKVEYPLSSMVSLCNKVLENYPIIDSIIEFDKIKLNFPDLSDEQIMDNIGTIDSFYNCLIRYDLANEIKRNDLKNSKLTKTPELRSDFTDYFSDGELNEDEFWFIFYHARFATPIETATNDAISYTNDYFPAQSQYQNKADAYRHAVWNALICKESAPKKEWVSECQKIAKGFTDAHESGATKPDNMTDNQFAIDKSMDLHNNSVGRYYFGTVAYSYKRKWYTDRYVKCPSSDDIASDIYDDYLPSAIKVNSETIVSGYSNSKLVYFK